MPRSASRQSTPSMPCGAQHGRRPAKLPWCSAKGCRRRRAFARAGGRFSASRSRPMSSPSGRRAAAIRRRGRRSRGCNRRPPRRAAGRGRRSTSSSRTGRCSPAGVRQLETGEQFGFADVRGAEGLFGPLRAAAAQDQDLLELRVHDPVFLHAERPVFVALLRVVAVAGTFRHHLDHQLGNPGPPHRAVLLPLRRREVNGDVRMAFAFPVRDEQLAFHRRRGSR